MTNAFDGIKYDFGNCFAAYKKALELLKHPHGHVYPVKEGEEAIFENVLMNANSCDCIPLLTLHTTHDLCGRLQIEYFKRK